MLSYRTCAWVRDIFCGDERAQTNRRTYIIVSHFRINIIRREGVDCGGDGRRLRAHEKVKFAFKKLVLSNLNPGGCAFPSTSILIEPQHLRQDKSRPGDIVALGMGAFLKDTAMDCVIISGLAKSCLSYQAKSSDFSLRLAKMH
jgi:hypothetical protein